MLNFFKTFNSKKQRKIPDELNINFFSTRWQKLIDSSNGTLKRHFLEIATLDSLRESLKNGNVWVEDSRRYTDFKNYLLSEKDWNKGSNRYYEQLQLPMDSEKFLNDLGNKLDTLLEDVDRRFPQNEYAEFRGNKLKLSRIDPISVPSIILQEKREIVSRMSTIKLQDLLIKLNKFCPFIHHFKHIGRQSASGKNFKKNIFACLISEGCNIGFKQMADASLGIEYPQLLYVSHWYIHEDALRKAIVELVNFHHSQSLASVWGEGNKAMADGQRFFISANSLRAEYNPRYFGHINKGGVVYSHFSDQHSQFYVQLINCSPREAIFVLDGILNHDTNLSIDEIFTDTHGYTEYIFSLSNLLGVNFSPRIRDLPDQKLYKFNRDKNYKNIENLIDGAINHKLITEQWDDIVRVIASLKNRTVSPSLLLYRLNSYTRKNRLLKALREIGRIYKTIHILQYIDNPNKRKEIRFHLNLGEAHHTLARFLFFGEQGDLRRQDYYQQMNRISCLSLLINAVVCWNTLKMQEILDHLKEEKIEISTETLKHTTPLLHAHINPYGEYRFDVD
jgi:TnpA family transposase